MKSGAALVLVEEARKVVESCFGSKPEELESEPFQNALREARNRVAQSTFQKLAWEAVGWDATGLQIDLVRLRAVSPGLENIEAANAVFHCHRDTWYGNPSCQINAWVPLHQVSSANSFRFYTDYFDSPIKNDSGRFVASQFANEGGFGRVSGAEYSVYPKALETPAGEFRDVEQNQGDLLLFSAAHLHQTLPNRTERVRFSVDFRFFYQDDLASGQGAPDRDNQSCGYSLGTYGGLSLG